MVNNAHPLDPGRVTMDLLRRFEPKGRSGRREFLAALSMFAGGAHVLAQQPVGRTPRTRFPPQHSAKVMEPVNIHEIQEVAGRNIPWGTFEYINGGAEDEYTLIGNLDAYKRTWLRRRVMVDVSKVDTSLDTAGTETRISDHAGSDHEEPHRARWRQARRDRCARSECDLRRHGGALDERAEQDRPGANLVVLAARPADAGARTGLGQTQHRSRIDVAGCCRRSHRDAKPRSEHQERVSRIRSRRVDAGRAECDLGLHQLGARRRRKSRSS